MSQAQMVLALADGAVCVSDRAVVGGPARPGRPVASQSTAWRTIAGSLAVLVVSGWRRRRTGMPGPDTDPGRHRPAADVWHGDPRRAVVDRPAGADAESMAPDPGEPGAGPP